MGAGVLREAKAAKIPVILTDRAVNVKDDSLWVSFMGSDFVEEGRRAANWLVRQDQEPPPVMSTSSSSRAPSARPPRSIARRASRRSSRTSPGFKILRSQTGDFTRAKGKEVMEAFLKAEGNKINVLFAHNDDMAIGAIQGDRGKAGLKPGKDILIVSIRRLVKGAFQAMMAGKLNVSVECSPLLGPQLMRRGEGISWPARRCPSGSSPRRACSRRRPAAKEFPNRKY